MKSIQCKKISELFYPIKLPSTRISTSHNSQQIRRNFYHLIAIHASTFLFCIRARLVLKFLLVFLKVDVDTGIERNYFEAAFNRRKVEIELRLWGDRKMRTKIYSTYDERQRSLYSDEMGSFCLTLEFIKMFWKTKHRQSLEHRPRTWVDC